MISVDEKLIHPKNPTGGRVYYEDENGKRALGRWVNLGNKEVTITGKPFSADES